MKIEIEFEYEFFYRGYNHPAIQKVFQDSKNLVNLIQNQAFNPHLSLLQSQLVNRPALGVHPTPQFIKQIDDTLLPVEHLYSIKLIFSFVSIDCSERSRTCPTDDVRFMFE